MTVEQIIAAAIARNRKTQPDIQVLANELLGHYNRAISGLFSVAARVNPSFFGEVSGAITLSSGNFARTDSMELVYRIETPDGDRVWIVDVTARDTEPSRPAVYPWGRGFRPANSLAEALSSVTIYYSRVADQATALGDDIDADFPDQFTELLVLECAIYIALKDQRYDEVQALRTDRDSWLGIYVARLEHDVVGMSQVGGQSRRFPAPTVTSLAEFLAGGAGG